MSLMKYFALSPAQRRREITPDARLAMQGSFGLFTTITEQNQRRLSELTPSQRDVVHAAIFADPLVTVDAYVYHDTGASYLVAQRGIYSWVIGDVRLLGEETPEGFKLADWVLEEAFKNQCVQLKLGPTVVLFVLFAIVVFFGAATHHWAFWLVAILLAAGTLCALWCAIRNHKRGQGVIVDAISNLRQLTA